MDIVYNKPTSKDIRDFMQKATNAYNHFMNQQIYDAVAVLEDKPQSDLQISIYGEIKQYQDQTREFYWKDQLVFTIRLSKDDIGNLVATCWTHYNDDSITLEDYDDV